MRRYPLPVLVITAALLALPGTASGSSSPSRAAAGHHVTGIGIRHSFGTHSRGWGRIRPGHLFNGGDPSGDIVKIHWKTWGGAVARGRGKNPIFKPTGGYYRKPVTIRLRAKDPGSCGASGAIRYHHLYFSEPRKPGGRFGRWRIWTSYHKNLCTKFQ